MADGAPLTPGKVRGLAATSSLEGVFTVLAIDHRDSLRIVLDPSDPGGIPASAITEVKLDLLSALADEASAVMLEPEYSAAQAIVTRTLPGHVGFLVGRLRDRPVGCPPRAIADYAAAALFRAHRHRA